MKTSEIDQLTSYDDNELVSLYRKKGNHKAFSELVGRHQQKLYSYLLSMVGNEEVAADLFQDTFSKVITRLDDNYDEQGKFGAWLMRIAHNAAIDYLRKRKRVVQMKSNDPDEEDNYFERLPDDTFLNPSDHLELDEAKKLLMRHIQSLPEEQREVVVLRHYYDLSFKEIADLTNVSINTALGRMRYALINLRKAFDKENGKSYKFA